jgi:hypothetical protein
MKIDGHRDTLTTTVSRDQLVEHTLRGCEGAGEDSAI